MNLPCIKHQKKSQGVLISVSHASLEWQYSGRSFVNFLAVVSCPLAEVMMTDEIVLDDNLLIDICTQKHMFHKERHLSSRLKRIMSTWWLVLQSADTSPIIRSCLLWSPLIICNLFQCLLIDSYINKNSLFYLFPGHIVQQSISNWPSSNSCRGNAIIHRAQVIGVEGYPVKVSTISARVLISKTIIN